MPQKERQGDVACDCGGGGVDNGLVKKRQGTNPLPFGFVGSGWPVAPAPVWGGAGGWGLELQ